MDKLDIAVVYYDPKSIVDADDILDRLIWYGCINWTSAVPNSVCYKSNTGNWKLENRL